MKVGFEAKRLFTNITGLGNYSRFVVNALTDYCGGSTYYLYTPSNSSHAEVQAITAKNNVVVVKPSSWYKAMRLTSIWRSYGVSFDRSLKDLDVFHGLSQELPISLPKKVKKFVTVHDLIYIRYPQFYNRLDAWIYEAKARAACSAADKVVAVSRQTAEDVANFFNIPPEKINVVYQGCHENFRRKCSEEEIEQVKKKYNLPENYVLNVGTIEERKNLMVLVRALAAMPSASRPVVVVVGKVTDYYHRVVEKARELNVLSQFLFLHNVPFADFPGIYQGADVFVYPSLFEGFGIPLVEAIESGIPVVTSTGSCFREAAGPQSLYVDPHNSEALAVALENVLTDEALRRQMIVQSKQYIQGFAPDVIAGNLFSLYKF